MRKFFNTADVIVGHNIIRWDKQHLERILGIEIKCKLVDTLALSWTMFPDRNKHGIESWGESFGIKKPPIDDWYNLKLEEYVHRCEEDVKINRRLWEYIYNKLLHLYKSPLEIWRYIDYIMFKMECARLQEEHGWKIDVEYCTNSLKYLLEEQQKKVDALKSVMPSVPIKAKRAKPVRFEKKDGTYTKKGNAWLQLLAEQNLPKDVEETEVVIGYEEPNPRSPVQVKEWLFSLGWKPETFEYKKNKKGELRAIPQVHLKEGKGVCQSVKKLFEKEPALENLNGFGILNHRIPILEGFLSTRSKHDKVMAQIQGLTNTLRFQHAHPCVNLPRSNRLYSEGIRGSLIADDGYVLCGADMSSLEDRLKQHFIYPYDPEYVHSMLREDFDPHIELAMIAKRLSKEDKEFYQWYEKQDKDHIFSDNENKNYKHIKAIRSIFKNGNYACQYGAFPKRLAITCQVSIEEAKEIYDAYWKLNDAIKTVSKKQKVVYVGDEMWLQNPINKFYYSLRERKDIFSTLVQGSASYVFDVWVGHVLKERKQLTAQFHDEIVLCVKEGFQDKATELLTRAIDKTNNELKLNRDLGIGIQFGYRYSEIH